MAAAKLKERRISSEYFGAGERRKRKRGGVERTDLSHTGGKKEKDRDP